MGRKIFEFRRQRAAASIEGFFAAAKELRKLQIRTGKKEEGTLLSSLLLFAPFGVALYRAKWRTKEERKDFLFGKTGFSRNASSFVQRSNWVELGIGTKNILLTQTTIK